MNFKFLFVIKFMVTKKQLAALARGRAKRKQNCKTSKRKTKAEIKKEDEKKEPEKKKVAEPTQIILYNGEPIEVPISKIPKKKSKWAKAGKYAKNAAIAAATLGALGYGAYRSKDIYNKYLKDITDVVYDLGKSAVRGLTNTVQGAVDLGTEFKEEWQKGETYGESLKNVGKLAGRKAVEVKNYIKDRSQRENGFYNFVYEVHDNGFAVLRNQNGAYFVIDDKDKTYLYDNNNKCITKDINGNPIPYNRIAVTEAYNLNGDLIWAAALDRDPLEYKESFYDYLQFARNVLKNG